MYEKIKNDIAQEYYVKNYPNDGQRFVAWYLRNIHNLASVDKGIHNKTTKYGLPTY